LQGIRTAVDSGTANTESDEADSLRAAAARMGLIGRSPVPVVPLTGGVSSVIARVEAAGGTFCIKKARPQLRVSQPWFAPVERSLAEIAWLQLAQRIVPGSAPRVLGTDPESFSFAMEWLPPEAYPVWKARLRDGIADPAEAIAVGRRLAQLHEATAGSADIARQFDHAGNFRALRLMPYFAAAAAAHPDRTGALHALIERTGAARLALMHGDVSPKNILIGPQGPVFLDAECACYGDPAFDLAFCLAHLLLKCLWRPGSQPELIACFQGLARAYLAGVSWEPPPEIERRACGLLAGLLLARVDGKSPVDYLQSASDQNHVRTRARAWLAAAPARLEEMAAQWA
jgi:aminoglycoside phosphotransferase (APT) family kinase protein